MLDYLGGCETSGSRRGARSGASVPRIAPLNICQYFCGARGGMFAQTFNFQCSIFNSRYISPVQRILFLILVVLNAVSWGEGTIPLPRQTLYLARGLGGGVGLGKVGRNGCQSMSVWQVQGEYAYSPSLSGGANMKIYGGNVDTSVSIVYQRYYVHGKFHHASSRYDLYLGPVFGFDNTNLKTMRQEIGGIGDGGDEGDTTATASACADMYGAQGVSLGYEAGMGALLHPDWGMMVGHSFDLTTGSDAQFAVSLALAFNLWNHWERLRENLQGSWVVLEWNANLSLSSTTPLNSVVLGITLGF